MYTTPHCIQPFSSFTVRVRLTREQFRIQLIIEFAEDARSTIESNQLHCAPAGIGLNNQLCIARASDWSNQREPRARQTTPIRHAACRDNCVKKPKFYNFDETLPILRSYLSALSLTSASLVFETTNIVNFFFKLGKFVFGQN